MQSLAFDYIPGKACQQGNSNRVTARICQREPLACGFCRAGSIRCQAQAAERWCKTNTRSAHKAFDILVVIELSVGLAHRNQNEPAHRFRIAFAR